MGEESDVVVDMSCRIKRGQRVKKSMEKELKVVPADFVIWEEVRGKVNR